MTSSNRDVFNRFVAAMGARDFEALEKLIHPDFEGVYPQSRERFRGFASFRAQFEGYPGGLPEGGADSDSAELYGDEERWVITPGYTVLPLSGPDRFTTVVRQRYPDGSLWYIVSIVEMRDGLMYRSTTYFAPEFDPPAWREGLTERY